MAAAPKPTVKPSPLWLKELKLIRELLTDEEFGRLAAQHGSPRR